MEHLDIIDDNSLVPRNIYLVWFYAFCNGFIFDVYPPGITICCVFCFLSCFSKRVILAPVYLMHLCTYVWCWITLRRFQNLKLNLLYFPIYKILTTVFFAREMTILWSAILIYCAISSPCFSMTETSHTNITFRARVAAMQIIKVSTSYLQKKKLLFVIFTLVLFAVCNCCV